jgi:uncharacterized membrane protein
VKNPRNIVLCYLAVLILQPVWHGLLSAPMGNQSWPLTLLSTSPLLIPLGGILLRQVRSMTWGAYLLVLYFIVGIMEAWSNPAQRLPALVQVGLCLVYVLLLVNLTRRPRSRG